mmetsp:Transcript_40340/g.75389  ORF Transcript_40340/g.75389 Transcript_40340/m.75389 type:complete len:224 (-) Transcript_40340:143-814(-)
MTTTCGPPRIELASNSTSMSSGSVSSFFFSACTCIMLVKGLKELRRGVPASSCWLRPLFASGAPRTLSAGLCDSTALSSALKGFSNVTPSFSLRFSSCRRNCTSSLSSLRAARCRAISARSATRASCMESCSRRSASRSSLTRPAALAMEASAERRASSCASMRDRIMSIFSCDDSMSIAITSDSGRLPASSFRRATVFCCSAEGWLLETGGNSLALALTCFG